MTHFYVVAFAGMIESWLLGEIDRTPEELITFADTVLQEQILGARFENDSPYAIVDVSDLKKTTYRGMQSAELLLSY